MLIFGETQERKMTEQVKKNNDVKAEGGWRKTKREREKPKQNACISSLIFLIIILF